MTEPKPLPESEPPPESAGALFEVADKLWIAQGALLDSLRTARLNGGQLTKFDEAYAAHLEYERVVSKTGRSLLQIVARRSADKGAK